MGSYAEWESGWPALSGVRPRSGKREMRERERAAWGLLSLGALVNWVGAQEELDLE